MDDGGDIIKILSSCVDGVRERRSEDSEEEQDELEDEAADDIVCRKSFPTKSGDEDWHAEAPASERK